VRVAWGVSSEGEGRFVVGFAVGEGEGEPLADEMIPLLLVIGDGYVVVPSFLRLRLVDSGDVRWGWYARVPYELIERKFAEL
jgi:hypothetical protein